MWCAACGQHLHIFSSVIARHEQFFIVYYIIVLMHCTCQAFFYAAYLTEILIFWSVSAWAFAILGTINATNRIFVHLYICV